MTTFSTIAAHQRFKHDGVLYIRLRQGRKAMTSNGKVETFTDSTLVKKAKE